VQGAVKYEAQVYESSWETFEITSVLYSQTLPVDSLLPYSFYRLRSIDSQGNYSKWSPTIAHCLGDMNNDFQVNSDDYDIVYNHRGETVNPFAPVDALANTPWDINGDYVVDETDYEALIRTLYAYPRSCPRNP